MRIAMIGSGYVGLVSGACLAQFGHDVICIDKDADKIARLKKGEIPIYEPGLDKLVSDNAKAGRLQFGMDLADAVAKCDAVFIAVGTPTRAMSMPRRPRSRARSRATPWSSPSRPCRSAPAAKWRASFARRSLPPNSTWPRTPSSC